MKKNKKIDNQGDWELEFEKKFCNNHQKPIRFLRSIFYDEQDGAEQIKDFIRELLKKQKEEMVEKLMDLEYADDCHDTDASHRHFKAKDVIDIINS